MKLKAIGADIEYFVLDPVAHKSIVPCPPFMGTKTEKRALFDGHVHRDNMLVEINPPPATTSDAFVDSIHGMHRALETDFRMRLSPAIVHTFKEEEFYMVPDGFDMGCQPDFNGWTMESKEPLDASVLYRTAAGHVHISWEAKRRGGNHTHDCCMWAKALDLCLGVYWANIDGELGVLRRTLYGQAGSIRIKPYGVEYRTLSNSWTWEPMDIAYVFSTIKRIGESRDSLEFYAAMAANNEESIHKAINHNDRYSQDHLINQTLTYV